MAAVVLGLSLVVTGLEPHSMNRFSMEVAEAATEVNILNYESNTSATDYVITDIAGMEKLAKLVNLGTTDFWGKTVTLQADLEYDKSVENNYTIIGLDWEHSFAGTFKGENHKISGVNIHSSEDWVGLFGVFGGGHNAAVSKKGTIEKVLLEDSTIVQTTQSHEGIIGGIVGYNDGAIKNCVVMQNTVIEGKVRDSFVGGIAGISAPTTDTKVGMRCVPTVSGCINYGTVKGGRSIGGIVGDSGSCMIGFAIQECCNYGIVQRCTSCEYSSVGGIIGNNACAGVLNCFNAGIIIVDEPIGKCSAGGIAGDTSRNARDRELSLVSACYNVGQVYQGYYYGSITQVFGTGPAPVIQNCYWLKGTSSVGVNKTGLQSGVACDLKSVYQYTQTKMRANAFVDTLNKNSQEYDGEAVWEQDIDNINNGYPILKGLPYVKDTSDSDGEIVDNGTPVSHLFKDYDYTQSVTDETIQLYANGGTITGSDGVKRTTKSKVIYTDILASYIYNLDKKGNVVPSVGKVIVGVTSTDTTPTLVKGKIVDKDAAKIAKASIKSGRITVTAQSQAGQVYLWVMDTGKKNVAVSCPITVKMAPVSTTVLNKPYTDTTAKKCTSTNVKVGGATHVYLKPLASDKKTVVPDCTYQVVENEAARAYVAVTATTDPYCFEIKGVSRKVKGTTKVVVKFVCKQNGKSASVSVTVKQ